MQGELGKGEFADGGAFRRREHVPAAAGEVVVRPQVAGGDVRRGPRVQDEVVDVGEGIQVDQSWHHQALAKVAFLIDRALIVSAHEDDGISFEDDFAVRDEHVPRSVEPQNVPGRDLRVQGASLGQQPGITGV
ncbi:hypothetical protein D9M72_472510 [compost metagenome]